MKISEVGAAFYTLWIWAWFNLQNNSAWHCISPAASSFKLWRSNNDHRVVLRIGFENSNSHVVQLGGNLGTIITIYINCGPASRFWKNNFCLILKSFVRTETECLIPTHAGTYYPVPVFFFWAVSDKVFRTHRILRWLNKSYFRLFFFFSVLGFL